MSNGVERLVINTGPLISLGRVGALDIIEQLPIRFLAPQEGAQEIEAGERIWLPVASVAWLERSWRSAIPDSPATGEPACQG